MTELIDESLDTIRPEIINRTDLEDVPYYFVNCAECRKATEPNSEWIIAAGDAMDAGWRAVGGEVYCKDCIPLILQRIEEEADEAAELSYLCRCAVRYHNVSICPSCSKPYHKDGSTFAGRHA